MRRSLLSELTAVATFFTLLHRTSIVLLGRLGRVTRCSKDPPASWIAWSSASRANHAVPNKAMAATTSRHMPRQSLSLKMAGVAEADS